MRHSNAGQLKRWRQTVEREAFARWFGPPSEHAFGVRLLFLLARPPSVSREKRRYPSKSLDVDKLTRAVLDALTGVVFVNDSRVVDLSARKRYGPHEGVRIQVREM